MPNILERIVLLISTIHHDIGEVCGLHVFLDDLAALLVWEVHAVPHVHNRLVVPWVRDAGKVVVRNILQELPFHRQRSRTMSACVTNNVGAVKGSYPSNAFSFAVASKSPGTSFAFHTPRMIAIPQ